MSILSQVPGNLSIVVQWNEGPSMWDCRIESLKDERSQKFTVTQHDQPVAYAKVISAWRGDPIFRSFFKRLLVQAPYSAFRWETPALTQQTAGRPFEFVLLDCPALNRPAEIEAFDEHFRTAVGSAVVTFPNLSGDAIMVVPCPLASPPIYAHLASFVRQAPSEQVDQLFQAVGEAMQQRLSNRPVWLSTAGMGVAWLHVRLDSRPKYYGYQPYRQSVET